MAGAWYNFGGEGSDDDEEDALAPLLTDDDDEEAETTWQPVAESPGALGTLYAQAATASAPVLADGGRAQAVYVAASAANDHPPANGAPAPIAASTLFELARDPAHGATAAPHDPPAPRPRTLHITMPPSANAEEDKRRLTQIYDLMRDELFLAGRSQGAWLNGRPIRVSTIDALTTASVEIGWSSRKPVDNYLDLVSRTMHSGCAVRRAGSGALGLAYVSVGRIECYAEQHINAWDVAAGLLLVTEAGGRVNPFWAYDGLRQGNAVLASNALLAERFSALAHIPLA